MCVCVYVCIFVGVQGVLNITLAELSDTSHAYIVFISTPSKTSNSSNSNSNSSGADAGGEWEPTPWVLHVISDNRLQCTAL